MRTHRLSTTHVEELTPLTEDHLLFEGPRTAYGRVRVLHQIGAGSVGPVFRGEDPASHQSVVVKVLRAGLPPERATIVASALAAARERLAAHPALCAMLDSGLHDAEPYVVSVFVEGDTLDVALREYGPANIVDALPRLRLIADALDSAATAGIVHGSLHLRDIIVSPERTVLTGIGVASILERVGVRPPVRRPYTAPEIANGHGVSPAGDQFALAAIAHEWLSGRRISGPGAEGFLLPAVSPAGTEAVAAVFCRALAEQADLRYPTVTAFVDGLTDVSDALAPRTRVSKRRPAPAVPPRLAFDFLEDSPAPETAGADPMPPSPRQVAADEPALTLAIDAATDDAADVAAGLERDEFDQSPPDVRHPDVDPHPMTPSPPLDNDDVVAALDTPGHAVDDHPMADVEAATSARTHPGPDLDLLPAPPEPPDAVASTPLGPAAPDHSVPPPRRPGSIVVPPAGADLDADDRLPSSPAAWAVVLVVMVAIAVAGGMALVRWGSPASGSDPVASDAAPAEPPSSATPQPNAGQGSSAAPPSEPITPAPTDRERQPLPAAAAPAVPTPGASSPARPVDRPGDAGGAIVAPQSGPAPKAPPKGTPPKATPPKTASRPAPPAAPGRLLVRSNPSGAEVFVNGERRGVTPLAVRDLVLGAYAVRISRAGFSATEQRVTLDAARPSRALEVNLSRPAATASAVAPTTPGTLVVDSRPPGARVVIDGREAGRTPVTIPGISPGEHAVRIELAGFLPITTTARVEPGARARVAVSLTTERPR